MMYSSLKWYIRIGLNYSCDIQHVIAMLYFKAGNQSNVYSEIFLVRDMLQEPMP